MLFNTLCMPTAKKTLKLSWRQDMRCWSIVRGIHRWRVDSPYKGLDRRKTVSVRGLHRSPMLSPHKGPVMHKAIPQRRPVIQHVGFRFVLTEAISWPSKGFVAGKIQCSTTPMMLMRWASYHIRKNAGCACAGNAGNVFPPVSQNETAC